VRAARHRRAGTAAATEGNRSGRDRARRTHDGRATVKQLSLAGVLALALAVAAPARAEGDVCIWGTITGPDALVNGMSYGIRDYLDYLNQTEGGIAGNVVKTELLDGRYKLDEEQKIYRRCVDEEKAAFISGWSTGAVKALRSQIQDDKVPFITQSFAS